MRDYPLPLRRIHYHNVQTSKTFNFLTNNFAIPVQTVADLYRYRWQVELFFKWIKQHLYYSYIIFFIEELCISR